MRVVSQGSNMKTRVYKVIVIGDSGVGKTALVKSYLFDSPNLSHSGTIGVDFAVKTLQWKDGEAVKLQVWDIGGQDRSVFLTRVFCHRAHGCVIVFDVTNPKSFERVSQWKQEVDNKCRADGRQPIPTILVANKCDLDERGVKLKDIDQLVENQRFVGWREVSVKDGMNIKESMAMLVEAMTQHSYVVIGVPRVDDDGVVKLTQNGGPQGSHPDKEGKKKKSKCC